MYKIRKMSFKSPCDTTSCTFSQPSCLLPSNSLLLPNLLRYSTNYFYSALIDPVIAGRSTPLSILLGDLEDDDEEHLLQCYKPNETKMVLKRQLDYLKDLRDRPRNFQREVENIVQRFWDGHRLLLYRGIKKGGKTGKDNRGQDNQSVRILAELEGQCQQKNQRQVFMHQLQEKLEKLVRENEVRQEKFENSQTTSILLEQTHKKVFHQRQKLNTEQVIPTTIKKSKPFPQHYYSNKKCITLPENKRSVDRTRKQHKKSKKVRNSENKSSRKFCKLSGQNLKKFVEPVKKSFSKKHLKTINSDNGFKPRYTIADRVSLSPNKIITRGITEVKGKLKYSPRRHRI